MRVLILTSGNSGNVAAFITDLERYYDSNHVEFEYFLIVGRGALGYLKNLPLLKQKLESGSFNLIHAHYGLSGLLATLQTMVPVVVTFHGSDINGIIGRQFSRLAFLRSEESIFVSEQLKAKLGVQRGYVIPCGVDEAIFGPMDKSKARAMLGVSSDLRLVLFSSSFDRKVKNSALAFQAINRLKKQTQLKELKEMSRREVMLWMNAADVCLLTSFSEGSPQFVKESLACGTPIVSTNVGDVKALLQNVEGCYITDFDPANIAEKIELVFEGAEKRITPVVHYNLEQIFRKILAVYQNVISKSEIHKKSENDRN